MAGDPLRRTGAAGRRAVLTAGTAAALTAGLAGCETAGTADAAQGEVRAPSVGGRRPGGKDTVDVVTDFGARGDGRTDDSRAFVRAYRYAAGRVWNGTGRTVVDIPAGVYLIREPDALIGASGGRPKANGLRFRGAGKRMTQLLFAPRRAADSYLCRNEDAWANIVFEHLGFRSGTPGASFCYSYSTGQAQDYRFTDCEWLGEWTYGLALDGSNTNSEMRWEACRVGGAWRRAFLYSGLSERSRNPGQQDQFLNYWFNDMKVEYEWGNFLEFPYGGSVTCRGGSYIVTGRRPERTGGSGESGEYGRTSTFFRFPRADHHGSVQRFHAEDIRFEVRGPDTVVIDCAWESGTVHFNDCDDTANAFKDFAPGSRPHRYRPTGPGPLVRYDSCQLSGKHTYRPAGDGAGPVARYDMCLLANHGQVDFAEGAVERVRYVDCRGR
ncbi:glycosyl hydrolase family 28-related protein [Streptomyces sp. TRM 70361]|uniref:glycosyl hydrolase family 28-related protein n=1 Tax=Streptomyces sp. TRM 70361 TaxID=3116553 RepID=UPI002E7B052F|nr:glycosyl hydrolase family 28-related protein [Streptomyces sp. TRM 70361]MEE1940346.1 glycosyl hydrolase family 28-related protein [Streptomyces sp. TRM 70361]